MPEVRVDSGITLDLLDQQKPSTSATSDMPVVETHPDSLPKPDAAAPKGAKPEGESAAPAPADTAADKDDAPKRNSYQKRIDELTKLAKDAERRDAASQVQLKQALQMLEDARKAAPEKKEQDADPEPQEPDHTKYTDQNAYNADYRAYLRSLSAWSGRQETRKVLQQERETAQRQRIDEGRRKVADTYQSRVQKALEKYPDYNERVHAEGVPFTQPMADAIVESEHGTDVAYYLATNPEEFARVASLPPRGQIMELGYLSAQFRQQAKADAKPSIPKAPPPIRPLNGGTSGPVAGASATGGEPSMEEYAAKRRPELAKERVPGGVRR